MSDFSEINLNKQLQNAISDLGFTKQTPIQEESYSKILSGIDLVGIAQTGTGKTIAYCLPLLQELSYSNQSNPRILILVPTRELVDQVVGTLESLTEYITCRIIGVYGGTNMNTQKIMLQDGADIVVATPGRLYDLALCRAVQLKGIKKLVIDEVDVMLDLGFRPQLINIFELLQDKRQNIMFSATMTEEVDLLISSSFIRYERIQIALSGTPLDNISQTKYSVPNYYTKVNLLSHLLRDKEEMKKVVIFVSSKKIADRLFDSLEEFFVSDIAVIHSNKSQNYRFKSIKRYDEGSCRILVATDIIARGLDLDKISHVINFDTPIYAENYIHRIGRTGRAEEKGKSILFFTEREEKYKTYIEDLMQYKIPELNIPDQVQIIQQLTEEEHKSNGKNFYRNVKKVEKNPAFHEKKEKNLKINDRDKWRKERRVKYKKPKSRGDKGANRRRK
ncbi:MAG: DEAD/DEAH box helicase [Flavobacteriales bacterium]|nr:DEAD/DEAH box helicase [Flavobacteriales bacterium]|tara:strand:- start:26036 stop:27379 length:1344 start_codon:yes stop_codon:yes gene_type:complete